MDTFELSSDTYDPTILSRDTRQRRQQSDPQPDAQPQPRQTRRSATTKSTDKATKKTHVSESEARSGALRAFFTNGRLAYFFGIMLIIAAVYMLIVSISFFAHGAEDQSLVQNQSFQEISANADRISNTGGPLGAFVSHLLLSRWLGLGSFILIFYVGALGISLVKIHHFRFWNLTFKSLITAITLSILVGFITYGMTSHNYWGGEHGYYINHLLLTNTGIWGAIGVNILLVSAVILIFLTQIQHAYSSYRRRIEAHKARLEHERAVAEARRHKMEEMITKEPLTSPVETVGQESPVAESGNTLHDAAGKQDTALDLEEIADIEYLSPDFGKAKEDLGPVSETTHANPSDVKPAVAASETDKPVSQEDVNLIVNVGRIEEAEEIHTDFYDPTAELSRYRFPSIDLLQKVDVKANNVDQAEQEENKQRITKTLNNYGIEISRIEATVGPTITLYEIVPAEGVRINRIKNLEDDIALSLSAMGIRIIAPMPGKGTIGIEVPNRDPQIVSIRSILSSKKYQESHYELPMAMGVTITNDVYVADLCKMPHLLVAGATGMGKSVGLNVIIASLLYKKHPAELKLVLIDPKMVEFALYSRLDKHYLAKLPDEEDAIITDMTKVVPTLNSLVEEMEQRYLLLKDAGVRDIKSYNEKFISKRLNPNRHRYLPYIVVIIDEFADLIISQGREVETPISRLAAKARAIGIHVILATQRPSTNVITGVIKANFPGRIAFRVNQMVDSRTILDCPGANQLVGKGDMLFSRDGVIERVQCALISTEEVDAVCSSIAEQIGYSTAYELPEYVPGGEMGGASGGAVTDRDPLFEEAGRLVIESGTGSTSLLQRKYNIGYPRAGKIMDQLEIAGVVGATQGGKPRQVLMDMLTFDRYLELQ